MALMQIGGMRRESTMKNIEMFGKHVIPLIQDIWRDKYEDRWSPKPLAQRVDAAALPSAMLLGGG